MTQCGIENQLYFFHTGGKESIAGLFYTAAHSAHRIFFTGNKQNRQIFAHFLQVFCALIEMKTAKHIMKQTNGGILSAQGIDSITIHVIGIDRKLVHRGAAGGEGFVVGAKG